MHTETLGDPPLAQTAAIAARLLRRLVDRLRPAVTYELDDHLAQDIGARTYSVPLIGQGDRA